MKRKPKGSSMLFSGGAETTPLVIVDEYCESIVCYAYDIEYLAEIAAITKVIKYAYFWLFCNFSHVDELQIF